MIYQRLDLSVDVRVASKEARPCLQAGKVNVALAQHSDGVNCLQRSSLRKGRKCLNQRCGNSLDSYSNSSMWGDNRSKLVVKMHHLKEALKRSPSLKVLKLKEAYRLLRDKSWNFWQLTSSSTASSGKSNDSSRQRAAVLHRAAAIWKYFQSTSLRGRLSANRDLMVASRSHLYSIDRSIHKRKSTSWYKSQQSRKEGAKKEASSLLQSLMKITFVR